MRKRISATIPELTTKQIKDLKKFYSNPIVLGDNFSTSRIIIICVNYFWHHIFEKEDPYEEFKNENNT